MLLTIYDVIIQKTMSPRKSEEDVMTKFCKSYEGQKQSFIDVLKNLQNFTGKHVCRSLFFNKRDPTQMFSCGTSQIFQNNFFTEHLRWLLLEGVYERTSLVKILQFCHFNIFGIFRKMPIKINNE